MNKDIETMIELQRYWDGVLRALGEIEKAESSIKRYNKELEDTKRIFAGLEFDIKNIKMEIKQKEIDLAEKDDKGKKLENRRFSVKTEKELAAIDRELETINSERGSLEEKLIELFDRLEKKQSDRAAAENGLSEVSKRAGEQIKNLEERINNFRNSHAENKTGFDGLIGSLPPAVSSKFLRHTQSGNGKGIVSLQGQEICSGCNFKIPSHLAQEASKNEKLVNCTNCGRFIYRDI
ncbi:MAG: C4-type zinc ribbon domain-containing protein [Spirochaetes bacterium]|nr:C4-type zinc ribbon domain-containing protein [Spirochaetota bacterium]